MDDRNELFLISDSKYSDKMDAQNQVLLQILDKLDNIKGIGIDHISKATDGSIDTYTIYYTDDTTYSFEIKNGIVNSYSEISRVKDYLYNVYYNSLDYEYAKKYFLTQKIDIPQSGCSAIRNGDFAGGNLDWIYNENAEFIVTVPRIAGRYSSLGVMNGISGLTDDFVKSESYNEMYKIVPFRIVDGINEYGVYAKTNVVPTDKGINAETIPDIEMRESVCNLMLVRYVLDNFSSARAAVEYIRDYVSVYPPQTLTQMGYEAHYMIADTEESFLLEIIDNKVVITDMTPGSDTHLSGKSYMTNFYLSDIILNSDGKVYTPATQSGELNAVDYNKITPLGSGLERYNLIVDNYSTTNTKSGMRNLLNKLTYTNSYKMSTSPFWLTEFVGINELVSNSDSEEFSNTVFNAINVFDNRSRDSGSEYYGTWQTTHSAIYDLKNRKLFLTTQEDGAEYEYSLDWDVVRSNSKASYTKSGQVIIGENISVDNDGVISTDINKNYVDEQILSLSNQKVDKVQGKILSSNDYTDEDKTKLDSFTNYDDAEIRSNIRSISNMIDLEVEVRESRDTSLQSQIDAITNSSDVVDILASYQSLINYNTESLGDNDVIKVMQDATHDNAISYYRWDLEEQTWSYIGSQGPYYTKSESDDLLNQKVDKVQGKGLSTNDYTNAEKSKVAEIDNKVNSSDIDDIIDSYMGDSATLSSEEIDNILV